MKVLLLNGSPKAKGSACACVQNYADYLIKDKADVVHASVKDEKLAQKALEEFESADVVLLAFPLYVDGLPSHLLAFLRQAEHMAKEGEGARLKHVYAVANCGFYEGEQAALSLNMISLWCDRAGFTYHGGLGVGGGPMLQMLYGLPPQKCRMIKNTLKELSALTNCALSVTDFPTRFTHPNIPRLFYQTAGHMGWKKDVKKNGGRKKRSVPQKIRRYTAKAPGWPKLPQHGLSTRLGPCRVMTHRTDMPCPLRSFNPSTLQPFDPSTLQPFTSNPSTLQPFNPSTLQPFNPSTLQPFNPSTLQPFNPSTLQPFNPSTLQPFNPSTLQPFNPSTLQPFNPSTLQPFNPSTLQPFNPSTLQPFNIIPGTRLFVCQKPVFFSFRASFCK